MHRIEAPRHDWYTHLFREPLWSQDDLFTRIAVVVFHIFTLWIPWFFLFFPEVSIVEVPVVEAPVVEDSDSDSDSEAGNPSLLIQGPASQFPISEAGEDLVRMQEELPNEAYEEFERLCENLQLEEYAFEQDHVRIKDPRTSSWREVLIQGPQSEYKERIQKGVTLYSQLSHEIRRDFQDEDSQDLGPHELSRNNPWHTEELQEKAYQLLQVACLISCLTLEDISEGNAFHRLNQPDHYSSKLIYLFTATYHHIRCGDVYCASDGRPLGFYPALSLHLPPPTNWGHDQFESTAYGPDAAFHVKCRVLFSLFCEELREKFNDESLHADFQKLSKWHPEEFPETYINNIYIKRPPEFVPH